jgi:hypothetical protein
MRSGGMNNHVRTPVNLQPNLPLQSIATLVMTLLPWALGHYA